MYGRPRSPASLQFGAYVRRAAVTTRHVGRELGRRVHRSVRPLLRNVRGDRRLSISPGPADEHQAAVFHDLHDRYDMNAHGREGGRQTTALTDEFIDGYAIVGRA